MKPLKENANGLEKFWHWTKHTALKSTSEISSKHVENLRSVCQLGNLGFSLLSLGLFIPLISRIQTNKKEQAKKELAKAAQNAATAGATSTSSTSTKSTVASFSANSTSQTSSTTKPESSRAEIKSTDKNTAAFGAFFNS